MYFIFEKVNDYNLIAPAINTIYSQNTQFVSTSTLIDSLRTVSLIPSEEKEILMNRSDDKFSQKIRNLISHKVLENYNLAEISKNKIELTNHGKRLGKFIESKLKQNQKININELTKEENFLNNLLMAKLNINFNLIYSQSLIAVIFQQEPCRCSIVQDLNMLEILLQMWIKII